MSADAPLGEFERIARWTAGLPRDPNDLEGLGDDCAVLRVGDAVWLVSCDASVEGVHFDFAWCSPEEVGWRAMTSAVSDIAAMGGVPRFATVSLAAPRALPQEQLDALYRGLREAAARAAIAIVGGDTTGSPGGIFLDITVIGEAPGGRYLARSGARAGDVLAVTGWPGRSAAALQVFQQHGVAAQMPEAVRSAHLRPEARLAMGQWLAQRPEVHAMLDVSDGLVQDARHLAERSGLGLCIDTRTTPGDPLLEAVCTAFALDLPRCYWSGGEDYELAVAVAPEAFDALRTDFAAQWPLPLTRAGTFGEAHGAIEILGTLGPGGFDHFRGDV